MNKNILATDTYTVFNKTIINNNDKKILIMLYQPIIGTTPIALYNTLITELDKSEILSSTETHLQLMKLTLLPLEQIKEARKLLEAIGLLKTYFKEGNINEYIYEIYSPLKPNEFFINPTLNMALYSSLGKSEYKKLKANFQIPKINLDSYTNISSSFTDMFTSCSISAKEYIDNNIKEEVTSKIKLTNMIDFDYLKSSLSNDMINEKTFNKDTNDLLLSIAYIYNLDIIKLKELIEISLNSKRLIDKDKLRKFAREFYQFENSGQIPNIIYKNQPDNLKNQPNDDSPRSRLIHQFETITPYNFLKAKNKGIPPLREIKLLENLMLDIKLPAGVVNVLIDYVLKVNNNKLSKNFIETIATEWKRNDINTVVEAMEHVELHSKKTKKTSNPKTKKTPTWFNENQSLEAMTKDEEEQMNKLLEGYK